MLENLLISCVPFKRLIFLWAKTELAGAAPPASASFFVLLNSRITHFLEVFKN